MSARWSLIFDADGTLVDSEPLLARELAITFEQLGLPFTPDDYMQQYRGMAFPFVLEKLEQQYGQKVADKATRERLEQEMRSHLEQRMERELGPIEGIKAALDKLADFPRCVATNGPLRKVRLSMRLSGLAPYFGDKLFSAYEVGIWKPDPGLFLHAAKALDCAPEHCIVIDDAAVGLASGKAAGMHVIHINRFSERETTPEGAWEIHSMQALPATVEKIIAAHS